MTIDEDIAFWRQAAMNAQRAETAMVYIGIATGLAMAKADHDLGVTTKGVQDRGEGRLSR